MVVNGRDGRHLDLLRLDALRAGEAEAREAAHVEACEECQRALAALEAVAGALRAAEERAPAEIPAAIDRRVLDAYRAARERRARAPLARWLVPAGALAAAAALVIAVAQPWRVRAPEPGRVAGAAADGDDLNRDGTVDIVDAYLLSLRHAEGEGRGDGPAGAGGRLAAVDAVARKAVALP